MKKKKNGGEKIPLTWNGPRFLVLKSNFMFNLSVRLFLCKQALRDYDDMPGIIEAIHFSEIVKEAVREALKGRKPFEQTTNDKLNALKEAQQSNIYYSISWDDKLKILKEANQCDRYDNAPLDDKLIIFKEDQQGNRYYTMDDDLNDLKEGQRCNIYDKASLGELGFCCSTLGMLYHDSALSLDVRDMDQFITELNCLSDSITGKSHEAIGYWTAKMEGKKRTPGGGAKAMEERGKANAEAIKKIIAELGVRSLSVFRQDKKLRGSFYDKAKTATFHGAPLSEDRISKIARALLQG